MRNVFSFKRILVFQTFLALLLIVMIALLSCTSIISMNTVYDVDEYFGEEKHYTLGDTPTVKQFDFGLIEAVSDAPSLFEALAEDENKLESKLEAYLEKSDNPSAHGLVSYTYLICLFADYNVYTAILLLLHLIATLALPIIALIACLSSLLTLLPTRKKTYFDTYQSVTKNFAKILGAVASLAVITLFLPTAVPTVTAKLILIAVAVFLLINMVCAMLKDYTFAQRKYLAILQIFSMLGSVFTLGFCVMSAKSLSFREMFEESGLSLSDVTGLFSRGEFEFSTMFTMVITVFFIVLVLNSRKILSSNICRSVCCTQRKRALHTEYPDTFIKEAIAPIVAIALVWYMFLNEKISFSDAEMKYFIMATVAAGLIIVNELAVKILTHTVCVDLGKGGITAVLQGDVYDRKDGIRR